MKTYARARVRAYRMEKQPFSADLMNPITNLGSGYMISKPNGGCWFSPIRTNPPKGYKPYGWTEWNQHEDAGFDAGRTRTEYTIIGKILVIDDGELPDDIPLVKSKYEDKSSLDFEGLVKLGYQAVLMTQEGIRATHYVQSGFELYAWDCESVLVLDANCVQ